MRYVARSRHVDDSVLAFKLEPPHLVKARPDVPYNPFDVAVNNALQVEPCGRRRREAEERERENKGQRQRKPTK